MNQWKGTPFQEIWKLNFPPIFSSCHLFPLLCLSFTFICLICFHSSIKSHFRCKLFRAHQSVFIYLFFFNLYGCFLIITSSIRRKFWLVVPTLGWVNNGLDSGHSSQTQHCPNCGVRMASSWIPCLHTVFQWREHHSLFIFGCTHSLSLWSWKSTFLWL